MHSYDLLVSYTHTHTQTLVYTSNNHVTLWLNLIISSDIKGLSSQVAGFKELLRLLVHLLQVNKFFKFGFLGQGSGRRIISNKLFLKIFLKKIKTKAEKWWFYILHLWCLVHFVGCSWAGLFGRRIPSFFIAYVLCILRLFKLKTEGQTIKTENLTTK